jgi:hypothetical protein
MVDHVDQFITDLRADGHPLADDLANGLAELDLEGDTNMDAAKLYQAISWILKQPRTADEKLLQIERLITLPKGRIEIPSMRQFTGWY